MSVAILFLARYGGKKNDEFFFQENNVFVTQGAI